MISININYRLDFVGLSTDTKPTVQVEDGSTFYTVDTQELYVFYKGEWYLQAPIETTSDEEQQEETPVENNNKSEEVKEPVEEIKEPVEEKEEEIKEPEEKKETEPEVKTGDEEK